jgi:predicted ATPase/DNA-binding winged helix-turn-helix (wHTH) protein
MMSERRYTFGKFELIPDRRLLLGADQRPIRVGGRAFDLLVALVERAGEIVGREELIAAAWPNTVAVGDTSLRVHIAALRKALGEDGEDHASPKLITNVQGRGYCFVAPLTGKPPPDLVPSVPPPTPAKRSLPQLVGRVIGREASVETIAANVERLRIVTIAGPGGIGKTTVALQVASAIAERFADGVVFADLTAASQDSMVPGVLAAALGQPVNSSDVSTGLVELLRDKTILVVLDNCEHVIDAATALAEALCQTRGVHVLATSREILRATGEWVHRLPPLGLQLATGIAPTAAEALRAPAVELFVERASSGLGGYVLTDVDAPIVAEICRNLDGMALAIELAAGSIATMGLRGLAASLANSLAVLTQGRRTALPRHQTLRATLNWSYELLTPPEKAVFRRLAIFNGPFTLEAAQAVAALEDLPGATVNACVGSLVAKSLIGADLQGAVARYRFLVTSRAFAQEKLGATDEHDRAARGHAAYYQVLFQRAESEWETRPTAVWLADYAVHMPNVSVALERLFAPGGDAGVGAALTVAAVPLWLELSQMDECLQWVQRALAAVEAEPVVHRRRRMQLYAALNLADMRTHATLPTGPDAWNTVLEIAGELGDVDYQLRALRALWVAWHNRGEPRVALEYADRFCRLEAETEVPEQRIGRRLLARSLHLLGRLAEARVEVTAMLDHYVAPSLRSHVARFSFDQRVSARITLAPILFVQGHPAQALREMEDVIAGALADGHRLSLINALADGACPIALWAGDLAAAERYMALFEETTRTWALDVWRIYAECFRGELLIRSGDTATGVALLRRATAALQRSDFVLFRTTFLGTLAQGLADLGRIEEGLAVIGEGLGQCERTGEAWFKPELMRIHGLLLQHQGDALAAEACYWQSLRESECQGALSWSLRVATEMARLLRQQGREGEAISILVPVYQRIRVEFATPDVAAASTLLSELGLA